MNEDRKPTGLAEAVGCATQTLRSLEIGRRRPSREMAERMVPLIGRVLLMALPHWADDYRPAIWVLNCWLGYAPSCGGAVPVWRPPRCKWLTWSWICFVGA